MTEHEAQGTSPSQPSLLSYKNAPTGEVVATEAALKALGRTRPCAMLCAIGMFIYALVGGGMGIVWLVVLIQRRNDPSFPVGQFIVISSSNLLFAPIAIVGGVLAIRHHAAAGRAHMWRNSSDLERSLITQLYIWRWAALVMLALFATPLIVLGIAGIMGVFP